jgi:phage host-nuclease inhibitor protein Gam
MNLRIKSSGKPVLTTWADAEKSMQELSELLRKKAAAEAKANSEIDAIRVRLSEETKEVSSTILQLETNLENFANFHKEAFEGAVRKKDLTFGVIGFRKSPGKLVALKGWKWETIMAKIVEMKRKKWIDSKPTVNKDAILGDFREKSITADELAVYGIKVDESDSFWYEIREAEAGEAVVMDFKSKVA